MASPDELRALLAAPDPVSPDRLRAIALEALQAGLFEAIVTRMASEVAGPLATDAGAWQILGLAQRALLDSSEAHESFRRAAVLAPSDPLIAHSLARTALEAGMPAIGLFDAAHSLAPTDAGILLGRAGAQLAAGHGEVARSGLAAILAANPGWNEGHAAYARMTAFAAPGESLWAPLNKAMIAYPGDWNLRAQAIRIALDARDYEAARRLASEARTFFPPSPELDRAEAICLGETGRAQAAQALFDHLPPARTATALVAPVRNLVRLGRYDQAIKLAETRFDPVQDRVLWPYRALLWRLLNDQRWQWLEGDERLVGVYDLGVEASGLSALAKVLRKLHATSGTQLDQSVRGGTQTDGNLFARAEPELRRLRAAVLDAVADHVKRLPPAIPGHPTLLTPREPQRIAGAWSVRLTGRGFHVDHIHLDGWYSSAFYVTLPAGQNGIGGVDDGAAGWLALGENRELIPDLAGFRLIEPKPGRLVLFPSLMWHGTRPFGAGERIAVAFDIADPG